MRRGRSQTAFFEGLCRTLRDPPLFPVLVESLVKSYKALPNHIDMTNKIGKIKASYIECRHGSTRTETLLSGYPEPSGGNGR